MADESELKPVYLLTGSDRPKIELALHRLRRHFVPESIELTTAQELPGAEVAAVCNAGSLFGDARLVVVEHIDGVRGNEGRLTRGWKAADVKAVESYLGSPAPSTTLALVARELKKDAALYKACGKVGAVLEFSVAKNALTSWIAQQFAARGGRADRDACAALLQLVGDDLHQLASEIDKLATWAGDEPIGEHEVATLVPALAETPSFMLTDAWGRRDTGQALDASEIIFERDDKHRRELAPRLAGALGNHVTRVRQCQKLAAEGVRPRDAAGRLKMHPFYAEKLFGQAQNFSEDELRDAVLRLAELDLALKGKSRLAPDLELQRALVDLSRA